MLRISCLVFAVLLLWPPARVDRTQALLDSARAAVGGSAITKIRSLSVDFIRAGTGMDFVLPDKFRYRTGSVAHIISGASFRQSVSLPPEVQATAHARTEFTFAVNAIKYLLTVPAVLDIRVDAAPTRSVEPFGDVDVLRFSGRRGFRLELFLDRSTHSPVGSEYLYPMEGDVLDTVHAKFEEYRDVAGVRFPFVTSSVRRGYPQTTTVAAIHVDPDLNMVFAAR